MPRSARPFLLLLLAIAVTACHPARRKADTDIVRHVKFDGNGGGFSGQNDLQLRGQLEQQASPFGVMIWPLMYLTDPETLDRGMMMSDAYRLEIWYAHQGYFDAAFQGWTLQQVRRRGDCRVGVYDSIGHVDPGPLSMVRSFEISGLGRTERIFGATVKRAGAIRPEEPFSLENVEYTRTMLIEILHDHSRAYAKIEVGIEAHPDEQVVDVTFDVTPGISAAFGPITVAGNKKVKERFILGALPFEEGDAYKLSHVRRAQSKLFEMGTFSVVTIQPDLSDPTVEDIPVTVNVTESKFRKLRLGVGGEYDGYNASPTFTAKFTHANLFRQLIQLELEASTGFVVNRQFFTPIYDFEAGVVYPRIPGTQFGLRIAGGYEQQLQTGQFVYQRPEADIEGVWRATDDLTITFGPHYERYEYLLLREESGTQLIRALFGRDFQPPFQYNLFLMRAGMVLDWRQDPATPSRGSYWSLGLRQAIPGLGDYNFFGVQGEARAYRPVKVGRFLKDFPLVIAGKMSGQVLIPWAGSSVPYPELAFLGGSTSLRGFRLDQVGPYDALCIYDEEANEDGSHDDVANQRYLPRGGRFMYSISSELRYDVNSYLTFASFVDTGILAERFQDIGLDKIRYGGGVGMRFQSPVGPIRLDLAARPLFEEDFGPEQYIGCDHIPIDRIPRSPDILAPGRLQRAQDPAAHPIPFALNLYLAIGEAI